MGSFLDTIYDVIFHPRRAMRDITERRLVGQALFLFFISMMMPPWALRGAVEGAFPMPAAGAAVVLEFVVCLAGWFFAAAVFSIVAEMFGGRGSALSLFAALGFCWLPRIAVMPFWAGASFLPEEQRAIATGFLGIIVAVWILFLSVEAIRASHEMSFLRAAMTMLFPVFLLAGIIAAIVVFTGVMLASWFS
jgi:hypothetical protein